MTSSRSASMTRRELLRRAGIAFVAFQAAPALRLARAAERTPVPGDPVNDAMTVPTMEAFADTLIPGVKRNAADRAIAGAAGVTDEGAVQAGAVDLMLFDGTQIAPIIGPCAAELNARATTFAPATVAASPDVPPFVALSFDQRTAAVLQVFDGPDGALWEALGAVVFLAYHTAGHLHTKDAIRDGHPGLAAIGFPAPDGPLWGWDSASYGVKLAAEHSSTVGMGSPA